MDETYEKLKKIVSAKIKGQAITPDSELASLGLDSLDKAEILINIEDEFKIEFNEDDMNRIKSVGDLLDIIKAKKKQ